MAKPVERGQRASAGPSHSDQRPQFSQPPRPGTPFSGPRPGSPFPVPQWDDDILSQWGKRLPHRPGTPFRGQRPGTPFSVSQGIDDSAPQWETYLTSTKFPRDFASPGVLRLARHKFRCQKPYKDTTAKIPYTGTADSLRSLRALIKTTSSKKTLDPLKELKGIKEGQVLLSPEVPDCRSNPLSTEPRPSVLPPATRKRVASTSVHRPRKVQRSLDMSTVFEEPMDFDHSRTRVSATSPRHCAGGASEKVNENDRVPGPSSADSSTDQRGLENSKGWFAVPLGNYTSQNLPGLRTLARAGTRTLLPDTLAFSVKSKLPRVPILSSFPPFCDCTPVPYLSPLPH